MSAKKVSKSGNKLRAKTDIWLLTPIFLLIVRQNRNKANNLIYLLQGEHPASLLFRFGIINPYLESLREKLPFNKYKCCI